MNIIIYEDNKTDYLKPFSINHASFEMQCGLKTNLERVINTYGNNNKYILLVRSEIESLIRFRYPEFEINPNSLPRGKFINGALAITKKIDLEVLPDKAEKINCQDNSLFENIWDPIFLFNDILKEDFSISIKNKYFFNKNFFIWNQ